MQKYEYYYEGAEFYCYPDTNVLINKFHIKNDVELDKVDRQISALKAVELGINHINGKFDFVHICEIHRYLFGDIYEWAGQARKGGFMSKGGSIFTNSDFIESNFNDYYEKLIKENYLKNLDKSIFCERLSYFMGEVNSIHPFRDGNGRTARLYFSQLAANAGYKLLFNKIDKDELLLADVLAYQGNYRLLTEILNQITTQI